MARTTTTQKTSTQKASRFSIRASATQKRIIAEAARIKDTTISDFVLEQSLTAAQHVIVDQVQFRLPKKRWKEFCDALDVPPKPIPALRKRAAVEAVCVARTCLPQIHNAKTAAKAGSR